MQESPQINDGYDVEFEQLYVRRADRHHCAADETGGYLSHRPSARKRHTSFERVGGGKASAGEIQFEAPVAKRYTALVRNALADQPAAPQRAAKDETPFPALPCGAPPPPLPAEQVAQLFRGDYPRRSA
ncbi:MAG: hypothetical protein R2911_10150 [Caldilineaceae bacterium]